MPQNSSVFFKRPQCLVALGVVFCGLLWVTSTSHAAPVDNDPSWVATWGAAMMANQHSMDFTGQTLREIVHTSPGGQQVRIWLSNRYGTDPLYVGAAHVALTSNESAIQSGSDRPVTFNHQPSIAIPPGATIVSDPIPLQVHAFSNLAVSIYFPKYTTGSTVHVLSTQTSYAASGNQVDAPSFGSTGWTIRSWYFLSGVDVDAPGDSAVVTLGDSITDGSRSKLDTNQRWPDFLAARLAADPATRDAGVLGVVNAGIAGNQVLLDGSGPGAVSRVNWDVIARSGARYLIVLEGINDITRYPYNHQPYGDLEKRLEWGLAQIATQAHQHGILVFGATLTPYGNCTCATPEGMAVRHELNHWIRTNHAFDGFIDFAKVTRDPAHPEQYLPAYDSDDHMHPSKAGYQAIANAINLALFTKK